MKIKANLYSYRVGLDDILVDQGLSNLVTVKNIIKAMVSNIKEGETIAISLHTIDRTATLLKSSKKNKKTSIKF